MSVAPAVQPMPHSKPNRALNLLPGQKVGFFGTLLVVILAAAVMLVYLLAAVEWHSRPFLGAMLTPYLAVDGSRPITAGTWEAVNAGLDRLDLVTAINGQALFDQPGDYAGAQQRFMTILSGLEPGRQVELTFIRGEGSPPPEADCRPLPDSNLECRISFALQTLPNSDLLTYFVLPFVSGLITLVIAAAVLLLRPNQPNARLVSAFSACLAIFMVGMFNVNNTYQLLVIWLAATWGVGAALGALALTFPIPLTLLYRMPRLVYLPAVGSVIGFVVSLLLYLNPPNRTVFPDVWQPGVFYAVLMLITLAGNLIRHRHLATSTGLRDQANTVLIGIALTASPILIWAVDALMWALTNTNFLRINTSALMPFFVMPSLALAYAILQYRRLNTDRIISQGITYSIMLVALVLGYFLLVFGASLFANQTFQLQGNELLIALMIFILAVLFLPVRTFLQERIDRIYYRRRFNYQDRIEQFTQRLTTLETLEQIVAAFRQEVQETLNPAGLFVFLPNPATRDYASYGEPRSDIRFDAQSGLVELLQQEELVYLEPGRPWPPALLPEKARLGVLQTMAIARLRGRAGTIGFICLGSTRKDSGVYTFEQLRFIQNLTAQLALSVERAQVVTSLERRVRELDVLSQVSQAVNFTIEFDYLLELIYAQTDRLVSAPYFYIALRDRSVAPGTDRLYFAFISEDGERYTERENRRWTMGRDLLSQVVREGIPVRVDDYTAEMNARNAMIVYESLSLKGWMGVPLIAGTNTLGVIAVADVIPGKPYTDDQLKILGDVATLAATSLDKARLFAETNLRARQLSALNEISQKLASELNVDNLLQLITESAVKILDAEAGSLLLTPEEDTKVLEFKIAVGSSGKELVGQRFPKNRGLAGEAATSAKPVIVNDAANDPRWAGEFAKGEFSTTAVLAVPLMAQNRVIGVLEVLNKKGGGQYGPDDAELLATFAGQAAVAIENARLFQMTDLQLTKRVDELQAMERIDVELNRSLDLKKVADITMRWAIANTGATAGVLGLVEGEPAHLEIVAMYGYRSEDFPAGADGMIWPLDRGIVSRVMRTRQPDLATDVRIDPSYIPSLRSSQSQMTIPMMSGGEINAILVLEKDHEPRLSLVDLSFAQRLAEHASIAISNAQINAELTRANESKSEFVSFVAHELKTPMTSMKGYADLLMSGVVGPMNDQQRDFLTTIRSNIDRMNTLVSDLNDVTKLQTNNLQIEPAPVDFQAVVQETLRPLHKQLDDKEQRLTLNLPDGLPPILADQNRLIQVMTNLVSNAHKYSPEGSEIVITGRLMEKNLDAKGRDQGPALHVSVRDQGIGMSEEDLQKLFTPYFRSENPQTRLQPGTGLGLTITRGIIERHRGQVWVESVLGEGTTFNFTIPVVLQPEAEPVK